MSADFNSIAKSRARYYLKGAPVQFVQVELLKMENANSMAVTLTFENIANLVLNKLDIAYVCKDRAGNVVTQNSFTYDNLQVNEGEYFGSDDAVFVSEVPLSNVEVKLIGGVFAGRQVNLQKCRPMPLPELKPMLAKTVENTNRMLNINYATYVPCNVEDGWQCTCGAFNYNTGKSTEMCTECGLDKTMLFNVVRAIIKGTPMEEHIAPPTELQFIDEQEQSGVFGDITGAQNSEFNAPVESYDDATSTAPDDGATIIAPSLGAQQNSDDEDSDKFSIMKSETAEAIIKFAPLATLGASALYFVVILLINILL